MTKNYLDLEARLLACFQIMVRLNLLMHKRVQDKWDLRSSGLLRSL